MTCSNCGNRLEPDLSVCRHCLHILDRDAWLHDAGPLGADDRGAGRPLEEPPVGPIPLTIGGLRGGAFGSALRAIGALFPDALARPASLSTEEQSTTNLSEAASKP